MARRHIYKGPKVEVHQLTDAAELITIEDLTDSPTVAGHYVRLRFPAGTTKEQAEEARAECVRAGARAVRLLPIPRDAAVPLSSHRGDERPRRPREEVERILQEIGDPDLTAFCEVIMGQCKV